MIIRRFIETECASIKSLISISRFYMFSKQSQMSSEDRPVESSIRKKMETDFDPIHLQIINESHMHNVPKGSESHFKIVCVSKKFENMPLVQRHRAVHSTLNHELSNGVHALSIIAKPPSEWSGDLNVEPSPKCLGGFGK